MQYPELDYDYVLVLLWSEYVYCKHCAH